jgi:hypothetical protein
MSGPRLERPRHPQRLQLPALQSPPLDPLRAE